MTASQEKMNHVSQSPPVGKYPTRIIQEERHRPLDTMKRSIYAHLTQQCNHLLLGSVGLAALVGEVSVPEE